MNPIEFDALPFSPSKAFAPLRYQVIKRAEQRRSIQGPQQIDHENRYDVKPVVTLVDHSADRIHAILNVRAKAFKGGWVESQGHWSPL